MAEPTEEMLSAEVHEKITSGLDKMSGAEAQEAFSEKLENFLEEKGISESDIISGQSEYASAISEEAFNGLEFSGIEGTGLSLADVRHMMTDEDYRLEMAGKHLTGSEVARIEQEYTFSYRDPVDLPDSRNPHGSTVEALLPEGREPHAEAVRTKEFMHYELRDALNSGAEGSPATFDDFEQAYARDEWKEMKGDQAAFHQNDDGVEDLKFIHPDGRELVYDGATEGLMTDDRYMGTYNYENATIPADSTPGPVEAFLNTRTEGSLRHREYDVDTWIELGNTRADRDAHGGEGARQAQFDDAVSEGIGNSVWNIGDFQEKAQGLSDAKDWVSDKADQAGDTIGEKFKGVKSIGSGLWREGAINPAHQTMDRAHIQEASLSETTMPIGAGTIRLEEAIGMLTADQKAMNAAATGEQTSSVQDAVNHPDAAEMYKNLHTHGVETILAEITPGMGAEDRVRELLLAGQEATKEAGIPMPAEQRELDAAQELDNSYHQDLNNSYEDDYSVGV